MAGNRQKKNNPGFIVQDSLEEALYSSCVASPTSPTEILQCHMLAWSQWGIYVCFYSDLYHLKDFFFTHVPTQVQIIVPNDIGTPIENQSYLRWRHHYYPYMLSIYWCRFCQYLNRKISFCLYIKGCFVNL